METFKLSRGNFTEIIRKAIKAVSEGKIIVCPTDTVYGLAADAANKGAVGKLFRIKKRRAGKPIPIFVKNIKTAKRLALIDKKQEKFLAKVWPGKITVVLKRKKGLKINGVDKKTIGLRIPKYRLINVLLEKINRPLTGTSANISGKPASTKINEVVRQFKNKKYRPDLFIDAGNLPRSRPSKIIDLTGKKPKILRE